MEAGVTGDHLGGQLLQGEDSKNVSPGGMFGL